MSILALLATLQSEPLLANSNFNQETLLSQNSNVLLDEDSFLSQKEIVKTNDNISLHLISHKAPQSEFKLKEANSVLFDEDSDINYAPPKLKSLTVIDTTISDWQTLASGVKDGSVLLLKESDEPLTAMISELQKIGKVDSLNIISHGSSGKLNFKNRVISTQTLEVNSAKWQELGNYLNQDGDILLYGCNVASGEGGKEFIERLANLTKADVGASINPTGNAKLGGDWKLEVAKGDIRGNDLLLNDIVNNFSNILAYNGTINFNTSGNFTNTGGNSASNDVAYTVNSNYSLQINGTASGVKFYNNTYIQGGIASESSIVLSFSNGETFDVTSIKLSNFNTSTTFKITSSANDTKTATIANSGSSTLDLSTFTSGITSLTITNNAGGTFKYITIDDLAVTNLQSAPTVDSDGKVTASATVNESSMISIPTTANTLAEKVSVFDFTITDVGTSDGVSTDVTQIVLNTSGTGDFSKMKWLLSGNDLSDINGSYNSTANTITFSDLNISVANGTNETYTLSAYFQNPTGLTDNSTFGFSINGSSDITVDTSKSAMASGQSAVTNSTNAKVDITATKLIFKTMPSN